MKQLKTKLKKLLPKVDFELDTGSQSFVVYPTNHIHLTDYCISINVGHIIYGNVTTYDTMIDNIKDIYQACKSFVDETGEYIQVVYFDKEVDHKFKVILGGLGDYDQVDEYFTSVDEMLTFINNFEFEEIY